MPTSDRVVQLRKGVLELAILAVLGREECYAIEIIERLNAYPALTATPGTVYPLLARLDKSGLVGTRWAEAAGGPPRKYYRLTPAGRDSLSAGADAWAALSGAMTEILEGTP
ncbi:MULTISPECIES: PadR family transcriptional regulator [unclassified Microbacterium]|uniref:PadR family transcriptional regulator n=1 Tax=unclassified Microbacterium TaxID=2609290 RepID=UPI00214BFD7C|nr:MULTISPECIES: PadR family transcriptional regulator [unclassified Microbacterium]MCR2784301.1 PadR family transcriptional regulator [Microbacterium sp. zg.B96]MDL5350791.1 PadR family transcriptional regulator [Microbacterium sp. zg-YB36]WIM14871.1 PadR family transcriptional regulator [Microbacterium sp. zg-B96]